MNPKYPSIQEMIQKLQEAGRTPIVPAPNRWFADPVKHPFQQKMIERVLAQTKQGREGFPSGSYINPQTGEPMDFDIMHDLGVAIDPNTGRPMMSGIKSDLTEIDPKYGSVTKSNLVRKGLFKHEGGDELLKNLAFLATIEKSGKGHHYGLSTHYASPAELVNTMTGKNPTLRPHSRGDIFGVGDEVGRISIQGKHHPVYEKLLVAPAGSDVQGKKLHKAKGGDVNKAKFLAKSKIKERLYHGTTKDFGLFSHKHQYSGEGGSHSGSGFYFTDNPESASRYSMMRGESGSNVMPVHLNIKKPLHFDWEQGETTGAKLKLTPTQVRSIMLSHPKIKDEDESPLTNWGDIRGASFNKTLNDAVNSYAGSSMLAALRNDFFGDNHEQWLRALHKATGYDSGTTVTPNGERHYIAWFPEQIKSAIGNRGTYDTTDPDITKKLGGRVTHAHHLEIEERPL